jgi:hypothetical protein
MGLWRRGVWSEQRRQRSEVLRKQSQVLGKQSELLRRRGELLRRESEALRQESEALRQVIELLRRESLRQRNDEPDHHDKEGAGKPRPSRSSQSDCLAARTAC